METSTRIALRYEALFTSFRAGILGTDLEFETPQGRKPLVYADWTASGRLYGPIEDRMREIGAWVANTHTETSHTGHLMTQTYHDARKIIKEHIGATDDDALLTVGTGMTGAVVKLQRIMGLKCPEQLQDRISIDVKERPVVFITHMEHHSNQTTWLETLAEVVVVPAGETGRVDLDQWRKTLYAYADRPVKIAAVTAASNVTGLTTPYHDIARMMHASGGLCFVDFACSGPYVDIDMHPADDPDARLDAIYFSPHKFLGGPGSSGVLAFSKSMYKNRVPDMPGGGTVTWTNPWGGHAYHDDVEIREDGGTPGFLQAIRTSLCIRLKEQMGVQRILEREHDMAEYIFSRLEGLPGLHLLAAQHHDRLGVYSFYIEDLHYNLGVRLLNDYYGIQVRGGCSCAGTYGHYLLHLSPTRSSAFVDKVNRGDLSTRPGWIRMSIHPTTTADELKYICDAIETLCKKGQEWGQDYTYDSKSNEYRPKNWNGMEEDQIRSWLSL